MITINLVKDLETGKLFVEKWAFTPKEMARSIKELPSLLVHVPLNRIPKDFYKAFSQYYYEDNILKKYYL